MNRNVVSITKYDGTLNSLKTAIELSAGFDKLKSENSILLKPNVVWGGGGTKKIPKYGFITTSRVVEDLITLLREHGCSKISIGEGCISNGELASNTLKGYGWSGLAKVAKKFDVKLIDFNKEPYNTIELNGSRVEIASAIAETDFLIDIPVLKTHAMTKVSLGMKNLKGCLSMKSKKKFHMKDLNEMIALLNTQIKPDLTVIDGIYAMEKGPTALGRAHRMNLLIAGRDVLSCDMVGATILGIEPSTVGYIQKYAETVGRTLELNSIDIKGESIEEVKKPLEWKLDYEEHLEAANISGMSIQFPGNQFCTNCVVCADILVSAYCKDNLGVNLDSVELCFGAEVRAKKDSKKVILIGDCAIRANKGLDGAIMVNGCPPKVVDSMVAVINNTLEKSRARKVLISRMLKGIANKIGIYNEYFPRKFTYDQPEFDPGHF